MGPLTSLRILDFTTLLPGPFGSLMLADLGAEVLRVEAPNRPDLMRLLPPQDEFGATAHSYLNRNKRSIALNLKTPAAVAVVKDLVQEYDIVVEQFRPGVMARLGLSYDDLRAVNPRLIYCSVSGYGQTGPFRDRAGHDNNYLATAGVSSYVGTRRGGPTAVGIPIADVAGGSMHLVAGLLAAVIHRQQTGEGQSVDISMTDAAFSLNGMVGAAYLGGGDVAAMESSPLAGGSYYGCYETRDGRWMSVGSIEPHFLQALCETLGIAVPELRGFGCDRQAELAFRARLQGRFKAMTMAEATDLFAGVDACVEPVLTIEEAAAHPQLVARDMVVDVPAPNAGTQRQLASPFKFSASRPDYRHTGARLGQHTEEVLQKLGKSADEIEALRSRNCI